MKGFKKERHNPIDLIKQFWPEADISHITYDPELKKGEYKMIRGSGGDGTLHFTMEMLQDSLIHIVNECSYFKSTEPDWDKLKRIKYTVGTARHATVFGMIKLRCSSEHKYPGQRERISFPVTCEYEY
tara:strand:+ start:131 stop:514 length:384 start_codon:yes stop_codon:yes gene_type:complete